MGIISYCDASHFSLWKIHNMLTTVYFFVMGLKKLQAFYIRLKNWNRVKPLPPDILLWTLPSCWALNPSVVTFSSWLSSMRPPVQVQETPTPSHLHTQTMLLYYCRVLGRVRTTDILRQSWIFFSFILSASTRIHIFELALCLHNLALIIKLGM